MRIHWVISAAALFIAVGCGAKNAPDENPGGAADAGGDPQGAADAGPTPVTLKVHVRGPGASGVDTYVMLGTDPATPNQMKAAGGEARFDGVFLPQDVTVIKASAGHAEVTTVQAVSAEDVTVLLPGAPKGGTGLITGTLTGTDMGASSSTVTARFFPRGKADASSVSGTTHAYSIDTTWSGDFWVWGYQESGNSPFTTPLRAGLKKGQTLSPGGKTSVDIALDHTFSETVAVKIANPGDIPGAILGGSVTYGFNGPSGELEVVNLPALSLFAGTGGNLPALAKTPPFDDCSYGVLVGGQDGNGATTIAVKNGLAANEEPQLKFLPFLTLSTAASQSAATLEFKWKGPAVKTANALIFSDGYKSNLDPEQALVPSEDASFTWTVYAPPSATGGFKPFALPKASGAAETLPKSTKACAKTGTQQGCYRSYAFGIDDATLTYEDVVAGRFDATRVTARPEVRVSLFEFTVQAQ